VTISVARRLACLLRPIAINQRNRGPSTSGGIFRREPRGAAASARSAELFLSGWQLPGPASAKRRPVDYNRPPSPPRPRMKSAPGNGWIYASRWVLMGRASRDPRMNSNACRRNQWLDRPKISVAPIAEYSWRARRGTFPIGDRRVCTAPGYGFFCSGRKSA